MAYVAQVLKGMSQYIQKETSIMWKVLVQGNLEEMLFNEGAEKRKQGNPLGVLAMLAGAFYGVDGLSQFSTKKGLWNEKLHLPQESLEEVVKAYLAENIRCFGLCLSRKFLSRPKKQFSVKSGSQR